MGIGLFFRPMLHWLWVLSMFSDLDSAKIRVNGLNKTRRLGKDSTKTRQIQKQKQKKNYSKFCAQKIWSGDWWVSRVGLRPVFTPAKTRQDLQLLAKSNYNGLYWSHLKSMSLSGLNSVFHNPTSILRLLHVASLHFCPWTHPDFDHAKLNMFNINSSLVNNNHTLLLTRTKRNPFKTLFPSVQDKVILVGTSRNPSVD